MEAQKARLFPWPPPRVSFAHQLSLISVHTRPNKEKLGFKPFQAERKVDNKPLHVLTMNQRRMSAQNPHLAGGAGPKSPGHRCQPTLQGRATPTRSGPRPAHGARRPGGRTRSLLVPGGCAVPGAPQAWPRVPRNPRSSGSRPPFPFVAHPPEPLARCSDPRVPLRFAGKIPAG